MLSNILRNYIRYEKLRKRNDILIMALLGQKDLVEQWWHSPHHAFNGAQPIDVNPKKVCEYLLSQISIV